MDDPPRKSRRSSISEHIQRVFSVDRSDRKRSDGFQADRANAALVPKSEITIGFELGTGSTTAGDTVPSSFTHSLSNSRLPSVSTPGSSPPVHPVRAKDELPRTMASDMNAPETKVNNNTNSTHNAKTAEIDLICRSPTWEKDVNRKERRATKRLEAERKELEKRLSLLEDAQLKLDQGIYERNSRRLTKKQPLGSSTRSSSANTERPRSSSFTSLFSSKRRSRSRASSTNGSDRDSRSSLENGPPMIPLSLPEQFGTAVSRELASRHGTSLVPSHQMPRTLHHTSAKSDDLRENWKMAEEWKRKNGDVDQDQSIATKKAPARFGITKSSIARPTKSVNESAHGHPPRNSVPPSQPNPPPHSQATELSADLDRDSFTAALRNERNPPGVASRNPNSSSIPHGNPRPRNNQATKSQPENCPPASVIAARHLSNVSNASLDTAQSPTSPKPFQGPTGLTAPSMGNFPKKGRLDGSPKTYKSSPLALNHFTNKDVDRKQENSPIPTTAEPITNGNTTPLKSSEEQKGQGRMNANGVKKPSPSLRPVADNPPTIKVHTPVTLQQQQLPASYSFEDSPAKTNAASSDLKVEQMSRDTKSSPLMVPPLKHSGRRSNTMSSLSKTSGEKQETPVVTEISTVPVSDSADLKNDSTRKVYQLSDGGPGNTSLQSVHRPGHSRTSSHSSYGGSSYDTADEEVLDISKAHTKTKPLQNKPQTSPQTSPKSPPNRASIFQASQNQTPRPEPESPDTYPIMAMRYPEPNGTINPKPNPNKPKEIPPLAPNGPIAMIRQNLVQRTKKPQKDQVIAKLFVICCSCKYWHDMPSEIYARLACPERIPSESRLVRTFSRKSASHRRNSIFSSDPSGRGLPTQLRVQQQQQQQQSAGKLAGIGNGNGNVAQLEQGNGSLPFTPIQCNWCGHGMTRTCCQGWTTLVQMRDRHH